MTRRSRGREVAMQLLFQRDQNPRTQRKVYEQFVKTRLKEPELRRFCLELFDGVVKNQADIDRKISASSDNWKLHRIAPVDRNLLRIGAFELMHMADTPAAVAFDEMIELARRFGTSNSSSFVNGVLDRLMRDEKNAVDEAAKRQAEEEVRKAAAETARMEAEAAALAATESTAHPPVEAIADEAAKPDSTPEETPFVPVEEPPTSS